MGPFNLFVCFGRDNESVSGGIGVAPFILARKTANATVSGR